MRKYVILCKDHIISRGESEFWGNVRNMIPIGYKYDWAWNTPKLLTVNVKPSIEIIAREPEQQVTPEVVVMKAWAKEEREYYRMVM